MYQEAQQQGGPEQPPGPEQAGNAPPAGGQEGAVDADFEVVDDDKK